MIKAIQTAFYFFDPPARPGNREAEVGESGGQDSP
jgi:hypothetical protein